MEKYPILLCSLSCISLIRGYLAHGVRVRAEEAALAKMRQVKRGLMDDLLIGRVQVVWTTNSAKGTEHAKE